MKCLCFGRRTRLQPVNGDGWRRRYCCRRRPRRRRSRRRLIFATPRDNQAQACADARQVDFSHVYDCTSRPVQAYCSVMKTPWGVVNSACFGLDVHMSNPASSRRGDTMARARQGSGNRLLLNHHFSRLNHHQNRIAGLQVHLFSASPCDNALNLVFTNLHHHVGHDGAQLYLFDLTFKLVTRGKRHAYSLSRAREVAGKAAVPYNHP